ncbi:MAG: DUF3300 domain-containing protein [Alsobacter sp.]
MMLRLPTTRWHGPLLAALLATAAPFPAGAQTAAPAPAVAAPAAEQPVEKPFTRAEIDKLVMPIALYPDPLLAQLLPASAYPLDIVQASRWLERNKAAAAKGDFSAADAMTWDASVKALLRFPDVVKKMNDDLDWTSDLGDAFVYQPDDVANAIQDLRAKAETTGALASTKQQRVVKQKQDNRDVIVIEPTDPEVIYVPAYDPGVVYDYAPGNALAAGLIGFGTGVVVGSLVNNTYWNWGRGVVYPPVWPGYPGYRPPVVGRPGGNVNIGNDINIGGGGVNIGNGNIGGGGNINIGNGNNLGNGKPWRPDPDRYRPGQGTKPGLGQGNGVANRVPGDRPRPGGGAASVRPGDGVATRPAVPDVPNLSRPGNRPSAPVARPSAPIAKPSAPVARPQKPAARPAPAADRLRPDGAFGGMDLGKAAGPIANRGAISRAQAGNLQNFGGGGGARPHVGGGGGARPQIGGGGGGRPQFQGGGGRGGGGGGRLRGR